MSKKDVLRFYCSESKPQRLSFLIVGSSESISLLKPAILIENKNKYFGRLQPQFCESIESIKVSATPDLYTDFIVILLDPLDSAIISRALPLHCSNQIFWAKQNHLDNVVDLL
uniref:Uncharacterized protein n=1 Tax=Clastoptera arizonana TaxID=38151 RepID=A0A1B6D1G1_9HEMI